MTLSSASLSMLPSALFERPAIFLRATANIVWRGLADPVSLCAPMRNSERLKLGYYHLARGSKHLRLLRSRIAAFMRVDSFPADGVPGATRSPRLLSSFVRRGNPEAPGGAQRGWPEVGFREVSRSLWVPPERRTNFGTTIVDGKQPLAFRRWWYPSLGTKDFLSNTPPVVALSV